MPEMVRLKIACEDIPELKGVYKYVKKRNLVLMGVCLMSSLYSEMNMLNIRKKGFQINIAQEMLLGTLSEHYKEEIIEVCTGSVVTNLFDNLKLSNKDLQNTLRKVKIFCKNVPTELDNLLGEFLIKLRATCESIHSNKKILKKARELYELVHNNPETVIERVMNSNVEDFVSLYPDAGSI